MKKIKASFDQKDRVVCVTNKSCHKFYYQPVDSREQILLFITDESSDSVEAYFRKRGRKMNGRGPSLTIRELYEFKYFHNKKLTTVINRIPMMIDYVIREELDQKEAEKKTNTTRVKLTHRRYCEDYEFVA